MLLKLGKRMSLKCKLFMNAVTEVPTLPEYLVDGPSLISCVDEFSKRFRVTDALLSSGYDLLATDYAPSPIEARIMRASLDEQRAQLLLLNPEVPSTDDDAQSREIDAQRRALVCTIDIKSALLAPVRKLFPELLVEIFGFYTSVTRNCSPRYLTIVCRRWRRIARGAPELWTTINLKDNGDPFHILPMFLQLAAPFAVDIFVSVGRWLGQTHTNRDHHLTDDGVEDRSTDEDSDHYQKRKLDRRQACTALRPIREQIHRCRTLHLSSKRDIPIYLNKIFPCRVKTAAACLEQLTLEEYYDDLPPIIGPIIAPKLRHLRLQMDPTLLLPSLSASSSTLNTLKILAPPCLALWVKPIALAEFLGSCPRLQTFYIDFRMMETTSHFPSPISMSALEYLVVNVSAAGFDAFSFIVALRFPILKHLAMGCGYDNPTLNFETILQSPGWNFPLTLETITLRNLDLANEFTLVLHLATGLARLDLEACVLRPEVLPALTPAPGDSPYEWRCPRLKQIRFSRMHIVGDALLDMIAARAPPSGSGQEPERGTHGNYLTEVLLESRCTCSNPDRINTNLERLAQSYNCQIRGVLLSKI